ncbi:IpaD/SipD/SspD family type III secretion system needle tip protein [Erwinia piriflorinigrans]|nr:IpaD/SipD/SspD family type III secretion system needle tip protein [Erwinia piriflorinigrans]
MANILCVHAQTATAYLPPEKFAPLNNPVTEAHTNPASSDMRIEQTGLFNNKLIEKILLPGCDLRQIINSDFTAPELDKMNDVFEIRKMNGHHQSLKNSFEEIKLLQVCKEKLNIAKYKALEEKVDNAVENIRAETRNVNIKTKDSLSKLFINIAKESSRSDKFTTSTSYAELWARIGTAIASIKSDYVDFYADLMKKYTDMYQSFNENVQKASSDAVHIGSVANSVDFNKNTMKKGYEKFMKDVQDIDLGSVKNWDAMSQEEKKNMVNTLSPAFNVDTRGAICFNLEQYKTVNNVYPGGSGGEISTVSYHAWLATFNAAGSALQNNMQSFAQRYTQSNNTFDNLNKVLSGVISSLGESAKDVYKSLT